MTESDSVWSVSVDKSWLAAQRSILEPYHDLLATAGIERGLIGPREGERLWSRHLDNSAVVVDPSIRLVDSYAQVVDIGSGAGLPGLVWALVRPDLKVTLVEPLERRAVFLTEAVARLGLVERVRVVRARAQELDSAKFDVVTCRAVSSLGEVIEMSRPLLNGGGRILAMKGARAATEMADARAKMGMFKRVRLIEIGPIGIDGHPLARVVELAI